MYTVMFVALASRTSVSISGCFSLITYLFEISLENSFLIIPGCPYKLTLDLLLI